MNNQNQQDAKRYPVKIDLQGLIRLLAKSLYADADVFVREMIQNAHDLSTHSSNQTLRPSGRKRSASRRTNGLVLCAVAQEHVVFEFLRHKLGIR